MTTLNERRPSVTMGWIKALLIQDDLGAHINGNSCSFAGFGGNFQGGSGAKRRAGKFGKFLNATFRRKKGSLDGCQVRSIFRASRAKVGGGSAQSPCIITINQSICPSLSHNISTRTRVDVNGVPFDPGIKS